MTFRKHRRDVITPDITPLVDVVFLLLIFFMLSTTLVVSSGLRLNLPQAGAEPVRHERRDLRIQVDAAGTFHLGGRPASSEELETSLAEAVRRDRDTLTVIEADQDTPHKFVVGVMDRARRAGLHRLAIATKPVR